MKKKPRIVILGGGTGTYVVLSGLRKHLFDLTAVVSMFDSGGSSGRLRDEFGVLPPGDVRQALLALSELPLEKNNLRQLLDYRFENDSGLKGHSFGNLFLTALNNVTGKPDLAIAEAAKILDVKGQVLPVSLTDAHLCARLEDGTIIKGETNIDIRRVKPELKILDVFLDPAASLFRKAREAILEADLIVLGPGDLYTSLVPNLLVRGMTRAIKNSQAKLVFVCNLMTKHGETDGFKVSNFVRQMKQYLGSAASKLGFVLAHKNKEIPPKLLARYKQEKAMPVEIDKAECEKLGVKLVVTSVASAGQLYRHHQDKLAKAIGGLV